MKNINATILFVCLAIAGATAWEHDSLAADGYPLDPSEQPLLVVRCGKADTLPRLLGTRPARLFGLGNSDFSGTLPGTDFTTPSLKKMLAVLAGAHAENLWYCLAQQGKALGKPAGVFGWSLPGGVHYEHAALLETMGLGGYEKDIDVHRLRNGGLRYAVSRDAGARADLSAREPRPDSAWRSDLAAFLNRNPEGLGAWVTVRPLLGLTALMTGIDFRALANEGRFTLPDAASLDLFANADDVGFHLRFDNVIPPFPAGGAAAIRPVPGKKPPIFSITIPNKQRYADVLLRHRPLFSLANVDIRALLPQTLTLTVWRDDTHGFRWLLAGLLPAGEAASTQCERLNQWLDFIAEAGGIAARETVAPSGEFTVRQIETGDMRFAMAILPAGDAASFPAPVLLVAGAANDLPHPKDLRLDHSSPDSFLEWELRPDPATRRETAAALAALSRNFGRPRWDDAFFLELLPAADSGSLSLKGLSVTLESRSGLTALMAPFFLEFRHRLAFSGEPANNRLAIARLRFLLAVAHQAAFRGGAPETAAGLPASLAELSFTDAAGKRWLNGAFGNFPGDRRTVSEILEHLAAGRTLNAFRYRIRVENGAWDLVAETRGEDLFRLNRDGRLFRKENGKWSEFQESTYDRAFGLTL